jgi:hypothetical protein
VFKTVNAIHSLVGTLLSLAILIVIGAAGWFGYQTFAQKRDAEEELQAKEAEIAALSQELELKQREILRLDTALRLLKVDHRVARIDVLSQQGSAEAGDLVTHFTFVELDPEGKSPLEEPRLFSVKGDVVYVDALVVKFDDEYVEMGDPLRSASLYLFRRVFGENQKPSDGFLLDPVGSEPAAYRTGRKMSDLEREIWAEFWDYANDPVKAKTAGVRAAHGEAPFQKLIPGKRYQVDLRASGGLSFGLPEDLPPEARPGPPAEAL